MTPKEKAEKIYADFASIYHPLFFQYKVNNCMQAKECAIKCVKNIKFETQYEQITLDGYWDEVILEIYKIGIDATL